ncbi:hypothetical protein SDC9_123886 [bioreactor metagenome]|uniref:Uncharacterized protein n=1 Tax=bioreactor metagenome TaxID=1076179 RepID=A0A645CIV5_9ZZZZ
MHGLIQTQTLGVGPVQDLATGHDAGVVVSDELDIFCAAQRINLLEQCRERKSDPRDHHRPGLDAAQAVDAFFQRGKLEQVVDVEGARLAGQSFDTNGPRSHGHLVCIACRVFLVGAELVEVVVGRHRLVGCL